jgi:Transglycosylase-like domain
MPRTRYWYSAERNPQESPWLEQRIAWRARARRVAATPVPPWPPSWLSGAVCIHEHEGAWDSETGNGYEGGFQFLPSTWAAHGGLKFGADPALLPPRDQLTVAYWTWRDDGGSWREWGTAPACGLS